MFLELDRDESVRCIVMRGAGEKAFAPGNDISEFVNERSNVEQARAYGTVMTRTIEAIGHCRHPIVAQIHGICVGGALEIAGSPTSASVGSRAASACPSTSWAS